MGKSKKEQSKSRQRTSGGDGHGQQQIHPQYNQPAGGSGESSSGLSPPKVWGSFSSSIQKYQHSVYWVAILILLGCILGYAIGAGWTDLTGTVSPWRKNLGKVVRRSTIYQLATFQGSKWEEVLVDTKSDLLKWMVNWERKQSRFSFNPSHPDTFAVLREAIIREQGGYVHPDLGILSPAPCGAFRGIGMVSDMYHTCQTQCLPGTPEEKVFYANCQTDSNCVEEDPPTYKQEEVLLKIPLSYQMTRAVATETLQTLIPVDVQTKSNFQALDDPALLVLLLAHERGVGPYSRWFPYIATLPHEPSCGYSKPLRPYMLDALEALRYEMGVDVEGWSAELIKASLYADRIANGLNNDYGEFLKTPEDKSSLENLQWALCQVASRATAGTDDFGALRMVPILDMVNHDVNAGGFLELIGNESIANGDFVNANEDDKGAFVIRSLRHGRRRPLRKGQELMANYNIPLYTPLDWFLSLGFVPPERWGPWEKVEPVLPRVRKDGPFAEEGPSSIERWEQEGYSVLRRIGEAENKW